MFTDIRIHELTMEYAERERLRKARKRDMLRDLTEHRPTLAVRLLDVIGGLLITTGEALRREPATGTLVSNP